MEITDYLRTLIGDGLAVTLTSYQEPFAPDEFAEAQNWYTTEAFTLTVAGTTVVAAHRDGHIIYLPVLRGAFEFEVREDERLLSFDSPGAAYYFEYADREKGQ